MSALTERHETATEPQPGWCLACYGDGPLRPWPLANEWGDLGELVCGPCWLARIRGEVVVRYTGRALEVWSTHPVHGELFRGSIRAAGIVAHELQPSVRWQITDHDAVDLGEYVGDYVEAERIVLDATAWADEIETDQSNDEE